MKTGYRSLSMLLVVILVFTMIPIRAEAATSGSCGDNATWKLSNGTLTITGTGPITNFNGQSDVPWYDSLDSITKVVVGEGITTLGNWFCCWAENLTSVSLPSTLTKIPSGCFAWSGITSLTIPKTVTSIADDAFYSASKLKNVHISDLSAWCAISFPTATSQPLSKANNLYLNGELITDLVIPENITAIGGIPSMAAKASPA